MAEWKIKAQSDWEQEWRGKLGDAEFKRRLRIADEKADELLGKAQQSDDGLVTEKRDRISDAAWAEATFMRPQFHSVAMQMSATALAKAEKLSGRKWASVIYKLAGA